MKNLQDLKKGQTGVVQKVHGSGPLKRRFNDMGIIAGTTIEFVKVAPLGDPIQIKVKGVQMSIRKKDAKDIEIA